MPPNDYRMAGIDKRLARCYGVRLIIGADGMYENEVLREKLGDIFPLMARSGHISFETCSSVNGHCDWSFGVVTPLVTADR